MPKYAPGKRGRFYDCSDVGGPERVPSVTTILGCINKPALVSWAANTERQLVVDAAADLYLDLAKLSPMSRSAYITTLETRIGSQKAHRREMERAAEIGSQVHKLIEWNIRKKLGQVAGPEPKVTDKALWAFMAWEDWKNSVNLEPLMVEQVVWSASHLYAGTMDLFAVVNDKVTVLDWKSGKAIYSEAYLQNAAYRMAIDEMGWGTPEQGIIVRLPKVESDPEFEVKVVDEEYSVEELFDVFLAARKLFDWFDAEEEKREAQWKAKTKGA